MYCLAALHPRRVYLVICKMLLDFGASRSFDARDNYGKSALDWAKDGRPAEVVSLIEKYMQA
jgi:ankyrin repeat protein